MTSTVHGRIEGWIICFPRTISCTGRQQITTGKNVFFFLLLLNNSIKAYNNRIVVFHISRGNVTSSNGLKGVIQREDFINHEELSVWVEAENQHGSGNSKENVFNTADISESKIEDNNYSIFSNYSTGFLVDVSPVVCPLSSQTTPS